MCVCVCVSERVRESVCALEDGLGRRGGQSHRFGNGDKRLNGFKNAFSGTSKCVASRAGAAATEQKQIGERGEGAGECEQEKNKTLSQQPSKCLLFAFVYVWCMLWCFLWLFFSPPPKKNPKPTLEKKRGQHSERPLAAGHFQPPGAPSMNHEP